MLDIRATGYTSPVAEVDFSSVSLSVELQSFGDETGLVTGTFRVYNGNTGLLIHTSEIVPLSLSAGQTIVATALTDFDPPAPLDDTYFVNFDGNASNALVPDGIGIHLGSFYFDVKPVGMGPAPAAHHATHENGGSDELDLTGLDADDFLKTTGINPLTAYLDIVEMAPPGNPLPNTARIYAEDKLGHTLLSFRDASGMVRKLVRDSVFIGYNGTANPIPALSAVRSVGSFGGAPSLDLAQANAAATMPCIGITLEAIAAATSGRVMLAGLIENINTTGLAAGTRCWISPAAAGGLVFAPPTWPNLRQEVATILVEHATLGSAEVLTRSVFDDGVIDFQGLMNHYSRANGTASSATPTPNADTTDVYYITAQAEAATFGAPTGTPHNGQKLIIRILDNGTARALAWNAIYASRGATLPATTVLGKTHYVGLIYNSNTTTWDCVAATAEA